jgi:hypothetical protein
MAPAAGRLLGVLKSKPVEVQITASPGSRSAAWLAWYLRAAGEEVDCEVDPDEDGDERYDTWVSFDGKVGVQGRAIAEVLQRALRLWPEEADSLGARLAGGSMCVSIAPMGTNDQDKLRRAIHGIPRLLREMWGASMFQVVTEEYDRARAPAQFEVPIGHLQCFDLATGPFDERVADLIRDLKTREVE